jgi:hypothetical protein
MFDGIDVYASVNLYNDKSQQNLRRLQTLVFVSSSVCWLTLPCVL